MVNKPKGIMGNVWKATKELMETRGGYVVTHAQDQGLRERFVLKNLLLVIRAQGAFVLKT